MKMELSNRMENRYARYMHSRSGIKCRLSASASVILLTPLLKPHELLKVITMTFVLEKHSVLSALVVSIYYTYHLPTYINKVYYIPLCGAYLCMAKCRKTRALTGKFYISFSLALVVTGLHSAFFRASLWFCQLNSNSLIHSALFLLPCRTSSSRYSNQFADPTPSNLPNKIWWTH